MPKIYAKQVFTVFIFSSQKECNLNMINVHCTYRDSHCCNPGEIIVRVNNIVVRPVFLGSG